jgi:hypothetical protein
VKRKQSIFLWKTLHWMLARVLLFTAKGFYQFKNDPQCQAEVSSGSRGRVAPRKITFISMRWAIVQPGLIK